MSYVIIGIFVVSLVYFAYKSFHGTDTKPVKRQW
jgi:hypothetical protein